MPPVFMPLDSYRWVIQHYLSHHRVCDNGLGVAKPLQPSARPLQIGDIPVWKRYNKSTYTPYIYIIISVHEQLNLEESN
jgi:hypothetical protein